MRAENDPIVILTTSEAESDILKSYQLRRTATSAGLCSWTLPELVKSINDSD